MMGENKIPLAGELKNLATDIAGSGWFESYIPAIDDTAALVRHLVRSLEEIAAQGGNLPDDRLTSKTGPNDAVARGILYVNSREIAREALAKARGKSND